MSEACFLVKVRGPGGQQAEVPVHSKMTIAELKARIETRLSISVSKQRLITQGKLLKDGETVEQSKLQPGFVVQIVVSEAPVQAIGREESEAEDARSPSQM